MNLKRKENGNQKGNQVENTSEIIPQTSRKSHEYHKSMCVALLDNLSASESTIEKKMKWFASKK